MALAALAHASFPAADQQRAELLVLSARTPAALRSLAQATAAQVTQSRAPAGEDLCYSAARRRAHLDHRLAVVAGGPSELGARLQSASADVSERGTRWGRTVTGARPKLAFVFCGQGVQWAGMGRACLISRASGKQWRPALSAPWGRLNRHRRRRGCEARSVGRTEPSRCPTFAAGLSDIACEGHAQSDLR